MHVLDTIKKKTEKKRERDCYSINASDEIAGRVEIIRLSGQIRRFVFTLPIYVHNPGN